MRSTWYQRIGAGAPSRLRVLAYHRVAQLHDSPMLNPRLISATPAVFDRQMYHLSKWYQVVSLEQVLDACESKRNLPHRAVLITFDDAYQDFVEYAWPTLKRYRLPATVFVPTAYPDQSRRSFWWDRLHCALAYTSQLELRSSPIGQLSLRTVAERQRSLRQMQNHLKTQSHAKAMSAVDDICVALNGQTISQNSVLSWNQLRRLAREGVTLGPHSQTHPLLTRVPPGQARQEIRGSLEDLKREIGAVLPVFCYPSGDHDSVVAKIVHDEGCRLAFTTREGHNELATVDRLRLCRTSVHRRTSQAIFRLRLLRPMSYVDRWRTSTRSRPEIPALAGQSS